MAECPRCGERMESGYLGAHDGSAGIQWYRNRTSFGRAGEPVSRFDGTKTAYLLAQRCPECRLVLARY